MTPIFDASPRFDKFIRWIDVPKGSFRVINLYSYGVFISIISSEDVNFPLYDFSCMPGFANWHLGFLGPTTDFRMVDVNR